MVFERIHIAEYSSIVKAMTLKERFDFSERQKRLLLEARASINQKQTKWAD